MDAHFYLFIQRMKFKLQLFLENNLLLNEFEVHEHHLPIGQMWHIVMMFGSWIRLRVFITRWSMLH